MSDDFEDILSGAWTDPEKPAALPAPARERGERLPEEVFAETYVRNGRDGAAAVRKAGLQDARYDMSYVVERLLARVDVQAYITAAEDMVPVNRDPRQYTREYFLHGLQEVREKALGENQFPSAISAMKLQAQMLGYLDTTVNVNHTVSARELSLADLRAMVQGGVEEMKPVKVIEGKAGIGGTDGV